MYLGPRLVSDLTKFTDLHHTGHWRCVYALLALPRMPEPHEIPQLTTELIDMSREYLRQETIEPVKRLGKTAGMGVGGAMAISLGAVFLVLALYSGLKTWLPKGEWYVVLARLLSALGAGGAAGLVVWRMQGGDK
jgi:hypothetical protein